MEKLELRNGNMYQVSAEAVDTNGAPHPLRGCNVSLVTQFGSYTKAGYDILVVVEEDIVDTALRYQQTYLDTSPATLGSWMKAMDEYRGSIDQEDTPNPDFLYFEMDSMNLGRLVARR